LTNPGPLQKPGWNGAGVSRRSAIRGCPSHRRDLPPGRRGCCHPRPPQTRTCRFPASGSSRESFADGEVVTIAIDHRATQSLTGEATDPPTGAAIHCHYVDRAAGYLSLALFPAMALSTRRPPSLVRVPASPVPRCRRYYEGATTSHPRIGGRLFASLPPSTASSWFVFAAALPRGRRCLPSQGLLVPVAHSPGARPWTRMGSLRSSGDPSMCSCRVPGPRSSRCGLAMAATPMLPPRSGRRRPRHWLISGLTGAASAPADLRFAFRVTAHAQGSLPAGRLDLYREGVEPSGPRREVSARIDDHPPLLLS
jgi:hypothetical protein